MKTTLRLTLLLVACTLASCAAPSDSAFMQAAAPAVHGMVASPEGGIAMAMGAPSNRNRVHPFFGTP